MLRAFEALGGGFVITLLLNLAVEGLLKKFAPDWTTSNSKLSAGSTVANLGSSFLAAAAGGYCAAWIVTTNPMPYILTLGITLLVLAAIAALQERGKQPVAYLLASVAVSPLGALAGGLVRLRVEGIF